MRWYRWLAWLPVRVGTSRERLEVERLKKRERDLLEQATWAEEMNTSLRRDLTRAREALATVKREIERRMAGDRTKGDPFDEDLGGALNVIKAVLKGKKRQ